MPGGPIIISSNQQEPLCPPPAMNPRARMVEFVGTNTSFSRHPPGTRLPEPSGIQSLPFVDASKVVFLASGAEPARNQVIVASWKSRLAVLGVVLLRRLIQPCMPKEPPARIWPFDCRAKEATSSTLVMNVTSTEPSRLIRPMFVRA